MRENNKKIYLIVRLSDNLKKKVVYKEIQRGVKSYTVDEEILELSIGTVRVSNRSEISKEGQGL